ncbi:MAG: ATP-binding protein [Rhodobacteraceae bacterium]|nr:MAG: ATP-binding protein [Paracoccaceae bacterium]
MMTDRAKVLQVECAGKLEDIRCTLRDLHRYLQGSAIPREWVEDLNLVLAEVMTNIARHGYPDEPGIIRVRLRQTREFLECHITDDGIAFDPSHLGRFAPEPAELREGGYGWCIIRDLTRDICYERANGYNNLSFSIPFETMQ